MLAVIFAFLFGQLPNPIDYPYGIIAFHFHWHYLNLDPFHTLLGLVHWSLLLVCIFWIICLEWDLIGLLLCIYFFGLRNKVDFNLVFKVSYKLIGTYLFSLLFYFILFLFCGYLHCSAEQHCLITPHALYLPHMLIPPVLGIPISSSKKLKINQSLDSSMPTTCNLNLLLAWTKWNGHFCRSKLWNIDLT